MVYRPTLVWSQNDVPVSSRLLKDNGNNFNYDGEDIRIMGRNVSRSYFLVSDKVKEST